MKKPPGDASGRSAPRPDVRGGDSSEVGALLQQTRVSFGQSLTEVARDIRIRQSFLEAIETGRFDALPGQAYTIGFIRTYAEHLGLEPNEVVRRFKRETGVGAPAAKLNFPAPLAESGVPKGALLLVGAIIALLGYGIWYLTASRYLDVAELTVPLPEHLRQILPGSGEAPSAPGTAVALPKVEVPIEVRSEPAAPATGTPLPPPVTNQAAAPAAPGGAAPMAPDPQQPAAAPSASLPAAVVPASPLPAVPSAVPAAAVAAPGAPAAAAEGGRVLLRVTADSWVEVRDPGSRSVLVSRLMRAGESFAVPDRPGLTLLTGNAGGLEVVIDGQPLAPLGKSGTVRRGVPLDAEQLRGSLVPAAPPN